MTVNTFIASLDRIEREAKALSPKQVALTLIAAVPWLVGFLVAHLFAVVWAVGTWVWVAGLVGWRVGKAQADQRAEERARRLEREAGGP